MPCTSNTTASHARSMSCTVHTHPDKTRWLINCILQPTGLAIYSSKLGTNEVCSVPSIRCRFAGLGMISSGGLKGVCAELKDSFGIIHRVNVGEDVVVQGRTGREREFRNGSGWHWNTFIVLFRQYIEPSYITVAGVWSPALNPSYSIDLDIDANIDTDAHEGHDNDAGGWSQQQAKPWKPRISLVYPARKPQTRLAGWDTITCNMVVLY